MAEPNAALGWSLPRRIAFRFLFSYFILFVLTGQEIGVIPFSGSLVQRYTELWYAAAVWIGKHLLDIRYEIALFGDGSGDTTFQWILLLCYLTLAGAATVVWSVLDRRRLEYDRLQQWFRLLLRFSLGLALIVYGIAKVIPNQMPPPRPWTLVQRLGELAPMRLLWTFMGASPAYQRFTGLAELLGGVLLLVPRTVLLGALVGIVDMVMVVMLNLCYDVPVKIMSFHYLVMGLLLLAPDLRRLADVFLFNRTVEPAGPPPPLFRRQWLDRVPQVLFFLLGLWVIGESFYYGHQRYQERHPPRPPFYGAWNVEKFAVDGKAVPLFTDPDRWQCVVFQDPGKLGVERMIGSRSAYALDLDMQQKTMKLGKFQQDAEGRTVRDAQGNPRMDPDWHAALAFSEPGADLLTLDGQWEGRRIHAILRRMLLTTSRFHWLIEDEEE